MSSPLKRILIAATALPTLAGAAGVPKTCPLKSQQLKLARECFTGDMHMPDDFATFVGTDETSKDDLNYCFNAFVIMNPKKGSQLQVTVLKDNERGQPHVYNYALAEQTLAVAKSGPRAPASKAPVAVSFKNLKAECFAHHDETDKCSKGVFGFGSSDLPLTVELVKGHSTYNVKGATKDAGAIKEASTARALEPLTEGDPVQTGQWLAQVVKQRLMTNAQRKLAMISTHKLNLKTLADATTQFRYCRMALDGYVHHLKMADPFTEKERKTLDSLEDHLKVTAPAVK